MSEIGPFATPCGVGCLPGYGCLRESIFPDCTFASSTYSLWLTSGCSSFFHLVSVPSLLQPLGLDTSECPFGSLPLLMLSGSPFTVHPISIIYPVLVPKFANLQIRVLDALLGPCSPGAYACNCG